MNALTHVIRTALIALTMLGGAAPAFAAVTAPTLQTAPEEIARACSDRYGRLVPCRRISLI